MGQFFVLVSLWFWWLCSSPGSLKNGTSFFSLSKTGVLFASCTGEAQHHHLIVSSPCVPASCERGKVAPPFLLAEAIALSLLHKYFQYFVFNLLLLVSWKQACFVLKQVPKHICPSPSLSELSVLKSRFSPYHWDGSAGKGARWANRASWVWL